MRDVSGDNQADDVSTDWKLGPWERWTTDWNGEPIIEFDSEAHGKWLDKWRRNAGGASAVPLASGNGAPGSSNFESRSGEMIMAYAG
jgi:hypothetical protein